METKVTDPCPVEAALAVVGGRWKPVILYRLGMEPMRFGELRRAMPRITQKMLTQQLRELERDDIVAREIFPVVPQKVVYSLTKYGKTLKPMMAAMCDWGKKHMRKAA
jgi:DNA-binding HxlR family transcriptional regulator